LTALAAIRTAVKAARRAAILKTWTRANIFSLGTEMSVPGPNVINDLVKLQRDLQQLSADFYQLLSLEIPWKNEAA
jgi:hypothetical protein